MVLFFLLQVQVGLSSFTSDENKQNKKTFQSNANHSLADSPDCTVNKFKLVRGDWALYNVVQVEHLNISRSHCMVGDRAAGVPV